MKSSNIGGQAVMEGVMMRNQDRYAVAVRKSDGEIVVKTEHYDSFIKNKKIASLPIVRGVISFVDSLVLGMRTLNDSAAYFIEEEEEEEPKKDAKKSEKSGEPKEESGAGKFESLFQVLTIIVAVVMAVGLFVLIPYFVSLLLQRVTDSITLITLAEGALRLIIFFGYVVLISLMRDIQRTYMYHGAEHKCINCIEHGMELNVENVLKSSRLHKRCGTSFMLIVIVISIICFLFVRIPNPVWRLIVRILLIPVIAGIAYEFIRLAGRSDNKVVNWLSKPGMCLQRLTTKEPDASMAEVGIASVEAVFDWRQYLRDNFGWEDEGDDSIEEKKAS